MANQVVAHRIDIAELREREPHAAGIAALHVPVTGITDYAIVCRTMASLITEAGGEIRMSTKVTDIDERPGSTA